MYPNSQHVDEPTMTDLRGVLPGQRPPVDATVLDEPTSEVPIIRPAGTVETDPEPAAVVTEPAVEAQDAEVEDAEVSDAEVEDVGDPAPAADAKPAARTGYAEAVVETEPEVESDPGPEAAQGQTETEPVAEFVTDPFEATAPASQAAPPTPAFTPPVVPAFGADTSAPAPGGEMGKMAWSPAPPPGLVPVSDPVPFEAEPQVEAQAESQVEAQAESQVEAQAEPQAAATVTDEPGSGEPVADTAEPEPEATVTDEPAAAEPVAAEPVAAEPVAEEVLPAEEPAVEEIPAVVDEPAAPSRAPGEIAETPIAVWTDEAAQELRSHWRDLQVQFIDDPGAAVTGAKTLVTEAVRELADTLLAAQAELDPFHGDDRVDTETMRVAMRRYREFLDRVLAL